MIRKIPFWSIRVNHVVMLVATFFAYPVIGIVLFFIYPIVGLYANELDAWMDSADPFKIANTVVVLIAIVSACGCWLVRRDYD